MSLLILARGARRLLLPLTPLLLLACGKPESNASPGAATGKPLVVPTAGVPYATATAEIKASYRLQNAPKSMAPETDTTVTFDVTNIGSRTWTPKDPLPLRFGYHWSDPVRTGSWNAIVWDDSHRAFLEADVRPGATVTLSLKVAAPRRHGQGFKLIVTPLLEGPGGGWTTETPLVMDVDIR